MSTTLSYTPRMDMTYEEFAALYKATFVKLMSYAPNQVGSAVYAEKMADLADAHPEWAELVENEGDKP